MVLKSLFISDTGEASAHLLFRSECQLYMKDGPKKAIHWLHRGRISSACFLFKSRGCYSHKKLMFIISNLEGCGGPETKGFQ